MTACESGLGMEDGRILDYRITASSEFGRDFAASNARLNRPQMTPTRGAWSAGVNDLNQWIQADLGGLKRVSGVVIQGREDHPQWVKKFLVQYSENGVIWMNVEDGNGQRVRIFVYRHSPDKQAY